VGQERELVALDPGNGAQQAAGAAVGAALVEDDGRRRPGHGEHDVAPTRRHANVDPRRGKPGADRIDQGRREDHVSQERRLDD